MGAPPWKHGSDVAAPLRPGVRVSRGRSAGVDRVVRHRRLALMALSVAGGAGRLFVVDAHAASPMSRQ